jgi:hypothetical protein
MSCLPNKNGNPRASVFKAGALIQLSSAVDIELLAATGTNMILFHTYPMERQYPISGLGNSNRAVQLSDAETPLTTHQRVILGRWNNSESAADLRKDVVPRNSPQHHAIEADGGTTTLVA